VTLGGLTLVVSLDDLHEDGAPDLSAGAPVLPAPWSGPNPLDCARATPGGGGAAAPATKPRAAPAPRVLVLPAAGPARATVSVRRGRGTYRTVVLEAGLRRRR